MHGNYIPSYESGIGFEEDKSTERHALLLVSRRMDFTVLLYIESIAS